MTRPDAPIIEVEDLAVRYDAVDALAGIDLTVSDGEFVTIIGPSGSGKTTLLRAIGGLTAPTTGSVRVDGDPPSTAQEARDFGFVFQQHTLFPWKNTLENVTFLRELAGKPPDPAGARRLLERVGLEGFEDAHPSGLSGGMRQRVAIVRALHLGARILLMDEPFGELDELTREEMSIAVRRIWRAEDKTVLFVTHSVPEAVFLADRCVVLAGTPGRIDRVIDVDLPRPRDWDVYESPAFQSTVATVRRTLHDR